MPSSPSSKKSRRRPSDDGIDTTSSPKSSRSRRRREEEVEELQEKEESFQERRPKSIKKKRKKTTKKSNSSSSSSSSQNGNDKSKRSYGIRSDVDPVGYTTNKADNELLYSKEELNPLASTVTNSTSCNDGGDDDEDEYEEEGEDLLDDTFTFLMTAKYPFENLLCSKKMKSHLDVSESNAAGSGGYGFEEEEQEEELTMFDMSHKKAKGTAATEGVNPDSLYLPFWVGWFVIISQLFIYAIVISNVFRDPVPPDADVVLRMAQIFAVFVTLYTQSDFIDGIFLLTERWKAFKGITGPIKFNLSAFLRILAGNVGILSTFLLVMYSTEVVDLLLNFTAMEFVATLDDSAFELAAKGFLGGALERKSEIIREFKYTPRHSKKRRRVRFALYFFYILIVFTGFFVIVGLQARRAVGVDNEVYVQFDDTDVPELFGISGVYKGCIGFNSEQTRDIGYIDISTKCPNDLIKDGEKEKEKKKDKILPARSFVYCYKREGWVFLPKDTQRPCDAGHFLIRSFLDDGESIPSNAFDILTHSKATWVVARADIGNEAVLTNVVVESVQKIPSDFVNCKGGGGLLRTDKAESLQRPIKPLPEKFYPTFSFKKADVGCDGTECSYRDAFGQMFRPIFARPIHEDLKQAKGYQVVFYDSLRWNRVYLNPVLFADHIGKIQECRENKDDPECWKIFVKYFHSETTWRSNFTVTIFDGISEPMMLLSTADSGVPTKKLRWYESRLVDGRVLPGQLMSGFDETEIKGYVNPVSKEVCPLDDYYYTAVDENNEGGFFEALANLCRDGPEKACNELDRTDFGEDYDYIYDTLNTLLGCLDEVEPFGFECEASFPCNVKEKELEISFQTDFVPEESSIIAFFANGEEDYNVTIKNLNFADRTIAVDKITEFSIPENGLAELRFTEPNQAHLMGACVPTAEQEPCVQIIVLDSFGDGISSSPGSDGKFELSYGDNAPIGGGGNSDQFFCKLYRFGSSCPKDKGDGGGGGSGLGNDDQSIPCDYFAVQEAFPKNVTGGELPIIRDKADFLGQATFAATTEGFATSAPLEFSCLDIDDIALTLRLTTDSFPGETAVFAFLGQSLEDIPSTVDQIDTASQQGEFEMSEDILVEFLFSEVGDTYEYGSCVPNLTPCIQVVLVDTFGDGGPDGTFTYGDESINDDDAGSFSCRSFQFGAGCVNPVGFQPTDCSINFFSSFLGIDPSDSSLTEPPDLSSAFTIGCYDDFGEEITDCDCHPTCLACGFSDSPIEAEDCISCQDGFLLTPGSSYGTGSCT